MIAGKHFFGVLGHRQPLLQQTSTSPTGPNMQSVVPAVVAGLSLHSELI